MTLTVASEHAGALSDALLACGALSVDIADRDAETAIEQALYAEPFDQPAEPFDEPSAFWPANKISALFDDEADVAACIAHACLDANVPEMPVETSTIKDCDWLKNSRAQFPPIQISERLRVVPSWLTTATAGAWDAATIDLILDPGLAFGSGEHPTTQLCLRWLDENLRGGESVLDYGCGSGILAIAALKLGAKRATGIDIDPNAIVASEHNAVQNRVGARFRLPLSAAEKPLALVDVVLANILANPLIALAPLLAHSTAVGGRIVLSGILENQVDAVSAAYRQWFDLRIAGQSGGWICLSGAKFSDA